MEERRQFERFDLRLPAQVKLNSGQQIASEVIDCLTKDICTGGAYMEGLESLSEGMTVSVELKLPRFEQVSNHQALIQAKGEVVRLDEGIGFAISFAKGYRITPL